MQPHRDRDQQRRIEAALRALRRRVPAPPSRIGTRASLLAAQRRVLQLIARGAPLTETLQTLVGLIEEQAEGMRCAVLIAEPGGKRLRFAAAPSIPADYKSSIEPWLAVAPNMGSCGTAAYLRKPVYTRDTATDSRWKNCSNVAVRNGLRAIWSTPVLADDETVLGTFAMYYSEPRLPSLDQIQLIDMATQMARVAIERQHDEARLQAVERRIEALLQHGASEIKRSAAPMSELLSLQERRVLALVADGQTNREIAAALGLSGKTVKNYLSTVFQKLQVGRRARAAILYRQGV